jgi:PEP-CTERM motif
MRQRPRRVLFALTILILTVGFVGRALSLAQPDPISIPEPSASLCLGLALFVLAGYIWWSRKKSQGRN